jgi:hypothetical protein
LFLTTSVYAEFKVKINISADENTKNQVNSYMLRELRDLRDVYINDDYQYAVDVIVAKSIIGYIVSSIVMEITVQPNEFLKLVNLKSTA